MSGADLVVPFIGLVGGLAVFLFGLDTLTESLRARSGAGLRTLMARLTRNRFAALATGVGATVLLQSSSVTTVLAIGLVSAGIMTFVQSLGIVLGANVGTTVTAQLIAFDITTAGLGMLAGGYLATVLARSERARVFGSVLLGLGMVFLGMQVMGSAMRPLRDLPAFVEAMESLTVPILGVLAGAGFTALVQSSTAATALAIALAGEGLIALEAGVAIIIGANIGTCVTAALAAIGKPPEAVRVAVAHVVINLAGAAAWLALLPVLVDWSQAVSPQYPDLAGIERLAAETPRQLAMAHTLFNVSTALVLIWFIGPLGRFITRLVPERGAAGEPAEPHHLDTNLLAAPGAALEATRTELGDLGEQVRSMVAAARPALASGPEPALDALVEAEREVDLRHRAVLGYLSDLTERGLEPGVAREVTRLIEAVDELEFVADIVGMHMVPLGHQRRKRGVVLGQQSREMLVHAGSAVDRQLAAGVRAIVTGPEHELGPGDRAWEAAAATFDAQSAEVRALMVTGGIPVGEYTLVSDALAQYRRIHDAAGRIGRARQ
jgi:phosphate:Na+ symporter